MTNVTNLGDQQLLREHRKSWVTFERVVLFAVLHVALTLACLALAFLGDAMVFALLLFIGGTMAMIVGFSLRWMGANAP
jgi:hypothetical protein